jgi:hypothetical protein
MSPGLGKADRGVVMRSSDVAQGIGLRRVDWVRLFCDRDVMTAEAFGVGYRLPVKCPITLDTAAQLIASGIPYVRRHAHA